MKRAVNHLIFLFIVLCHGGIEARSALDEKPWIETKQTIFLKSGQISQHARKLLPYHEVQQARANCGIATTVTALNSLIQPPKFFGIKLFDHRPLYNQTNFFSPQVEKIVKKKEVDNRGISMVELKKALKTFRWLQVYSYEGPRLSHIELRTVLVSSLKNPNQRILGLFDRRVLHQRGTGHWSPIAAYDKKTDSFLILDVAKFKYKPFWVKAGALFNSMQTYNGRQPRGMLVIEKKSAT